MFQQFSHQFSSNPTTIAVFSDSGPPAAMAPVAWQGRGVGMGQFRLRTLKGRETERLLKDWWNSGTSFCEMYQWQCVVTFQVANSSTALTAEFIDPYPQCSAALHKLTFVQLLAEWFQSSLAYFEPGYVREYPHKIWLEKWYGTSILGSWNSHWNHTISGFSCVVTHLLLWPGFLKAQHEADASGPDWPPYNVCL